MSRIWARSLRGRVTLIATAVAAFVLIPAGIGGVAVTRTVVTASVWKDTRDAAAAATQVVRDGRTVSGRIPLAIDEVDLLQVVTPDRRVIASSNAAALLPPLTNIWPTPDDRIVSTTTCGSDGCLHLTAARVSSAADSPVVYAARPTPGVLATRVLEVAIAAQMALVLALVAWVTWMVTGRTLSPVRAMRSELDAVNATDLSRRVTVPRGEDEVAQLARSVNGTLDRLERSAEQQRQFASDASHELRTPIAGLRAQLESAQLYPEDTDLETLVDGALNDTDRLEAIITDLLLLARIGSRVDVVKERVDLARLVREELSCRQDKLPVQRDLAEGVVIEGVVMQLRRVVGNLLDNAQRHADGLVMVSVHAEDGTAVLAVQDDGAGIAPADRERVFERFTRLDAARSRDAGGTGLGLAIARDVAIAHRGVISVADSPRGARFVLRLPLA
ncbi:sensor histidine kinase [Nonomuraea africana]|uniref:histidine kinase n=1 Tax=Nonomuraea africana TaxID=46171 RepID=A0ABR9KAQ2_9ACTN|nr:HAMP domain-containing sensor histidine kinase [Nonomuraea africana]MBE1558881.1 signal transduction histidine kinase [Nonomuraea africana]